MRISDTPGQVVRVVWSAIVVAILTAPVPGAAQSAMARTLVRIETNAAVVDVHVEVARTSDERATGLMDRDSLPESAGMLFLFERNRDAGSGFYMYRTRLPLDIAFTDSDGRIVEILTMLPCDSDQRSRCPQYPPGVPYWMALEVNAGFFAARGIEVGDRLTVQTPFTSPDGDR